MHYLVHTMYLRQILAGTRRKRSPISRNTGCLLLRRSPYFFDEFAIQFYDDERSDEDRFLLIGLSNQSRILVVVHYERGSDEEGLRIISARKATSTGRQYYEGDPP